MFVCLSVGYTLLIKPNSIHMLYMGRSGIYRGSIYPIEKLTQSQQRFSVYERKRNSHIFLSDVAKEETLKVQAIFRFFFVYLTSRASDTLKVQTDYLTFGNLITTSDTPKVQSSEAIAVEEYLLKLYAAINYSVLFPSSKIHLLNINRPTTKPI